LLLALLIAVGCTDVTTNFKLDKDSSTLTTTDSAARSLDATTPDAVTVVPGQPTLCGDHPCACDDRVDNDGDMLVDGLDPECTGPFDDDESSFATGAPSGANTCHDCFWDHNAGSGDDDCRYPEECLQNPAFIGRGACSSCVVTPRCHDTCSVRTPNGCDCFGCCDVTRTDSTIVSVVLTDTCSLKKIDDPQACPRCVLNTSCANPCGRCELCTGRRVEDLPVDCTAASNTGPRYVCEDAPVCSGTKTCPLGSYCQLGCCLYAVQ
jgi:hypothetical protein